MASISVDNFNTGYQVGDDSGFLDIEFTDRSKKSATRLWRLSIGKKETMPPFGPNYAVLLRAEDEQDMFRHHTIVPRKILGALLLAARRDGLLKW